MKEEAVWTERALFFNWKSLLSIGALVMLAGVLSTFDLPSNGGAFGMAIVLLLVAYLLVVMLACETRVDRGGLSVGFLPYREKIRMEDLDLISARRLGDQEAPRLRLRRNGIGLPGFQLGWFSSSNGRQVFAMTAGSTGRVLIPTAKDFDVLVSSRSPDELVAVLRSLGARGSVSPQ